MTQNTKLKGETRLKWGIYSIISSHFMLLSNSKIDAAEIASQFNPAKCSCQYRISRDRSVRGL
jgi:hypothetical protein